MPALKLLNAFVEGNGPDNELKIIKPGIATLNYFRIFNRWGAHVFDAGNMENGCYSVFKSAFRSLKYLPIYSKYRVHNL